MTKNSIKYSLLIWLAYNLAVGAFFGFIFISAFGLRDGIKPTYLAVAVMNGIGLIVLFVWFYFYQRKTAEAARIFKERGICDDYINAMNKHYSKLSNLQRISLANAYLYLNRLDECEQVMNRLPGEALLHGSVKMYYYKTYICLYLCTGRYRQACDIFLAVKDRLDKFFVGEGAGGAAYFDDAALCLAIMHDFSGADSYRQLSEAAVASDPLKAYIPFMIMAELFILDGNMQEAAKAEHSAKAMLFSRNDYKYSWGRDSSLYSLEHGIRLAHKIREQLYGQ